MEHHSNLIPWQRLAAEKGATIRYIELTDEQTLDLPEPDALFGPRTKMIAMPHASNSHGHDQPDRGDRARGAATRRHVPRRRRAGRAAPEGRRAGDRLRLLRLLVAQDAGPHRRRRALRTAGDARSDGAVPRRRRDDPQGGLRGRHLERPALEVRGGHAEHRRRHRLRRGDRLPDRPRHGQSPRARDRDHRIRARPAAKTSTTSSSTARATSRSAEASSRSTTATCTRTTSARSSTATASPSARATTARSR